MIDTWVGGVAYAHSVTADDEEGYYDGAAMAEVVRVKIPAPRLGANHFPLTAATHVS